MVLRIHRRSGFTLVELLTVMAIIAILAALTLQVSGYVQRKAASARAEAEIKAMEAACEAYKSDNGIYPGGPTSVMTVGTTSIPAFVTGGQTTSDGKPSATTSLDPRVSGDPSQSSTPSYAQTSLYLYTQLSGDLNGDGAIDSKDATANGGTTPKSYMEFKPNQLTRATSTSAISASNPVLSIQDPWGSSYGYSTVGATQIAQGITQTMGYNPTFDLWSTSGKTTTPVPGSTTDITLQWIKNW